MSGNTSSNEKMELTSYESSDFIKDWPFFFRIGPKLPYRILESALYSPKKRDIIDDFIFVEQGNIAITHYINVVGCGGIEAPILANDANRAYGWLTGIILSRIDRNKWNSIILLK